MKKIIFIMILILASNGAAYSKAIYNQIVRYSVDNATSTSTAGTYVTKIQLSTFTYSEAFYKIQYSAGVSNAVVGSGVNIELTYNDTQINEMNYMANASSETHNISGFEIIEIPYGDHYIKLNYKSNGGTAIIKNSNLIIEELKQ